MIKPTMAAPPAENEIEVTHMTMDLGGGAVGMSIEHVRHLAGQMDVGAEQIRTLVSQLNSKLEATSWRGDDRNRFEQDWQGQHSHRLMNIAEGLSTFAARARFNADEQQAASGQ